MAQPAVDLPDPLNGGNLAGVANADDLLSQLAGDEIDRLLAESDGDAPPPPTAAAPTHPPAAAPPAAASPATPPAAAQPAPVKSPAVAAIPAPAVSSIEASIDEILADTATAATEEDDEPPHASVHAPGSTAAASKPVALTEAVARRLDPEPRPPRVGLLVKPLLWLNAPVANLPEPARELIGKVALVTLMNAVAVLAYVLIFVRHHR